MRRATTTTATTPPAAKQRRGKATEGGAGAGKKKRGQVVATIAAVAKALNVNQRTVKEWLSRGCPGSSGHYDVTAIATWREASIAPTSSRLAEEAVQRNAWQIREVRAKALKLELELQQLHGRLIDIAIPTRLYAQHIAEAKVLLEQLPDRVLSFVPSLGAATKRSVRQRVAAAIEDVLTALASALTSDATDK